VAVVLTDGDRAVATAPGQRLLASIDNAPATSLCLPHLAARADIGANVVVGVAPPGSTVTVTVAGPQGRRIRHVTVADQTAAFRADFRDQVRLRPTDSGWVEVASAAGATLALRWAAPLVRLEVGSHGLAGVAAAGRRVRVTITRGRDTVATAHARAADVEPRPEAHGAGDWDAALADAEGRDVRLEIGDAVHVAAGDDLVTLRVPLLTAEVDRTAHVVWGTAPADTEARVVIVGPGRAVTETLVTGPDGAYALSLAGRHALEPLDQVHVEVALEGGHVLRARAAEGGLSLDLDRGEVIGSGAPGVSVTADLTGPDGTVRATGRGAAGPDGRFRVSLRDPTGSTVWMGTGDTLALVHASRTLTVHVPLLTVFVDPLRDTVSGSADADGEVRVTARSPLAPERGQSVVVAGRSPDGRYVADLSGRVDLAAGTWVAVSVRTPDGHAVGLERGVPLLEVQHGGDRLSGYAAPGARVSAQLRRGETALSSRATIAGADGAFAVRFVDVGGRSVRLTAGDEVTATWQGATLRPPDDVGMVSVTVAAVTAVVDASGGRLHGRAPPRRAVHVVVRDPRLPAGVASLRTLASATGEYSVAITAGDQLPTRAGVTAEAGSDDAEGHRTYALAVVPLLEVLLGAPTVSGRAAPLAAVDLALHDGVEVVAAGEATTDSGGAFATVLHPATSGGELMRPGQHLLLREPESGAIGLYLPGLSVAKDLIRRLIHGTAPPGAAVVVQVRAPGRPPAAVGAAADDDGRWRVHESELPAGLRIEELDPLTVSVETSGGHRVRASYAAVSPEPSASPTGVATSQPTSQATDAATVEATTTVTAEPGPTPTVTPDPRPPSAVALFLPFSTLRGRGHGAPGGG